jgi:hypothetical protein
MRLRGVVGEPVALVGVVVLNATFSGLGALSMACRIRHHRVSCTAHSVRYINRGARRNQRLMLCSNPQGGGIKGGGRLRHSGESRDHGFGRLAVRCRRRCRAGPPGRGVGASRLMPGTGPGRRAVSR